MVETTLGQLSLKKPDMEHAEVDVIDKISKLLGPFSFLCSV